VHDNPCLVDRTYCETPSAFASRGHALLTGFTARQRPDEGRSSVYSQYVGATVIRGFADRAIERLCRAGQPAHMSCCTPAAQSKPGLQWPGESGIKEIVLLWRLSYGAEPSAECASQKRAFSFLLIQLWKHNSLCATQDWPVKHSNSSHGARFLVTCAARQFQRANLQSRCLPGRPMTNSR
jgi:hypothetical protein